jgi:hypothetical protein
VLILKLTSGFMHFITPPFHTFTYLLHVYVQRLSFWMLYP